MENVFYRDMINHLIQAGSDGVCVAQLARHIYNLHTTLFDSPVKYDSLRRMLNSFLWHSTRHRRSIFVQCRRGVYALKPHVAVQLDFDFADDQPSAPVVRREVQNAPQQLYLFEM